MKIKMKNVLVGLAAALAFAACGDDSPGTDAPVNDIRFTEGYVVIGQADPVSYLMGVEALASGATVGFDDGVEIPGVAIGVSFGDDPYLYVGASDAPEIVRYALTEQGLVEDARVSLAGAGTTSVGGYQSNLLLVSKEKAYYIDQAKDQLVVWNPTTMEVTGSVEFDEPITGEGLRTGISGFPLLHDGRFYIGLGWLDAQTLEVIGGAAVLVIDTETDETKVVRDPDGECGYSFSVVQGGDVLWVGSEAYAAAYWAITGDEAARPCMKILDPETLEFGGNAVYFDLAIEAAAGTLVPGPTATKAYLRYLSEDDLGMTLEEWRTGGENGTPVGNARVLSSRPAWRWAEVDYEQEVIVPLDFAPSSGATLRIDTGNGTLLPEFDNAAGKTYLRDFTGNVYGDIVLEAQGHVRSVAHLAR